MPPADKPRTWHALTIQQRASQHGLVHRRDDLLERFRNLVLVENLDGWRALPHGHDGGCGLEALQTKRLEIAQQIGAEPCGPCLRRARVAENALCFRLWPESSRKMLRAARSPEGEKMALEGNLFEQALTGGILRTLSEE